MTKATRSASNLNFSLHSIVKISFKAGTLFERICNGFGIIFEIRFQVEPNSERIFRILNPNLKEYCKHLRIERRKKVPILCLITICFLNINCAFSAVDLCEDQGCCCICMKIFSPRNGFLHLTFDCNHFASGCHRHQTTDKS